MRQCSQINLPEDAQPGTNQPDQTSSSVPPAISVTGRRSAYDIRHAGDSLPVNSSVGRDV